MAVIKSGIWLINAPSPETPAMISTASDTAQVNTIGSTNFRASPARNTKAFCDPIAKISENPNKKPETKLPIKKPLCAQGRFSMQQILRIVLLL
jgi:hypothetical protein